VLPNPLRLAPGSDLGAQDLRSVFADDSGTFSGLPVCFTPVLLVDVPSSNLRPLDDIVEHLPQGFLDLPAGTVTPTRISWFARPVHLKLEPQVPSSATFLSDSYGVPNLQRLHLKEHIAGSGDHSQPATICLSRERLSDHHGSTAVRRRSRKTFRRITQCLHHGMRLRQLGGDRHPILIRPTVLVGGMFAAPHLDDKVTTVATPVQ
jgi:hypothetical protein